jgi:hypothetical protein
MCWSLVFYLVVCCRKLGKVNIFVMYLFIEMSHDSQNLPPPADKPKNQLKRSFAWMEVRSLWVVWSHMHCRGGSCSELSHLRSKEVLSFISDVDGNTSQPKVYLLDAKVHRIWAVPLLIMLSVMLWEGMKNIGMQTLKWQMVGYI